MDLSSWDTWKALIPILLGVVTLGVTLATKYAGVINYRLGWMVIDYSKDASSEVQFLYGGQPRIGYRTTIRLMNTGRRTIYRTDAKAILVDLQPVRNPFLFWTRYTSNNCGRGLQVVTVRPGYLPNGKFSFAIEAMDSGSWLVIEFITDRPAAPRRVMVESELMKREVPELLQRRWIGWMWYPVFTIYGLGLIWFGLDGNFGWFGKLICFILAGLCGYWLYYIHNGMNKSKRWYFARSYFTDHASTPPAR